MTTDAPASPRFLTTKEVAELLRVKERKVYDLVAAEEIPHRRITGKLLFPRAEIAAWIEGEAAQAAPARPALLAGSHDPLLEWAVRESGCGLATLFDGSMDGLDRFAAGAAGVAGVHIPDESGWNIETLRERGLKQCVLIAWAARSQGLILGEGAAAAAGLSDLRGRRLVARQAGAGSGALFARLAAAEGLTSADFSVTSMPARTETEVAAAVAAGEADAALGLAAMARQFRLAFRPLVEERFDLLLDRRFYFTEPAQILFAFTATAAFGEKAAALGGYDIGALGEVRWLSP